MTTAPGSDFLPNAGDFRPYSGTVWRIVEAQHRISTNRLAASADDQALLEALVEDVKPVMPPAARRLHYLLATPFRYGYAKASRFRRAHERPGVFYASEHVVTAVAETAYWRLLFYSRSPGFEPPTAVVEHTAFTVSIAADRALDLTWGPFQAGASQWSHPTDYAACQELASKARSVGAQLIRYESARDAEHRHNLALFDPAAFSSQVPRFEQTWHFRYEGGAITAFAAFPSSERYAYTFDAFGLTPP